MTIDLERVEKVLSAVLFEFGVFDQDSGEPIKCQNDAISSVIFCLDDLEALMFTKPAAPEYDGTNLPPVGADQTVFVPFRALSLWASASTESTWSVVAHHSGMAVVVINECGQGKLTVAILSEKECRPVVSQAEKDRKAVISAVLDGVGYDGDCFSIAETPESMDLLSELYDLGFLRMPDEDVAKKARGESE
jgi:hypothetical protein